MNKIFYLLSAILLWLLSFLINIQYHSESIYVFYSFFGILLTILIFYSIGKVRNFLIIVNSFCIISPIRELFHVLYLSTNQINRPFIGKYTILLIVVCSLLILYLYSANKLSKCRSCK